jgi:large subunit ribosomal protein L28
MLSGARIFQRGFAAQSTRSSRQPLNRARRGLYGGKRVIFGNNVSHSKRRTRRRWKPNVQHKNLTR